VLQPGFKFIQVLAGGQWYQSHCSVEWDDAGGVDVGLLMDFLCCLVREGIRFYPPLSVYFLFGNKKRRDDIFAPLKLLQVWISKFQNSINDIAGNNKLSFTAEIWTPGGNPAPKIEGKVGTHTANEFPFLDMELSWSIDGNLKFGVHMKPNQQLKYLNAGSAHTPGCFKAITAGVCYRLTRLTTVDEDSANMKLDKIYPEHFKALNKAELLDNFEAPTLGDKTLELEVALKDEIGQATK